MANTITLFSSSRRNGNTGDLLDSLRPFIDTDIVDLADYDIGPYDYQHRNINDDFVPLINKVLGYERIIFVSPVYWYSVTPAMKAFMDRLSDLLDMPELLETGRKLRDKTAYVLCTSIKDEVSCSYLNTFKQSFEYLGMAFGGYLHANCVNGYKLEEHQHQRRLFIQLFSAKPLPP